MCRATLGARPVSRFTSAASASFSSMVRGVPGVLNTLNRVPALPNAQDGSSIAWAVSASRVDVLNMVIAGLPIHRLRRLVRHRGGRVCRARCATSWQPDVLGPELLDPGHAEQGHGAADL